ncbi:MAG TPA: M15 family metallopeptidase [Longimicrobiales bacterium]
MKPSVLLFLLLIAGCARAQLPTPTAAPDITRYVADYYAAHDTLYVRENNGRLEAVLKHQPSMLQHLAGDTFRTGAGRVVLGGDTVRYGTITLLRRPVQAGTFRITPLRPPAELRRAALSASPPPQPDTLRRPDLVELKSVDPTIKYDVRYATTNNFMGEVFYSSEHAFMQRPAAEAVARVNRNLNKFGYGLLIHDAYRPWYVTKMFWDATPDSLKNFVADPASGSRHNRGAAVDLTMYDLQTGLPVEMTGGYDEFSERSYPTYPGGTTAQRAHRDVLRRAMEDEGFTVYPYEWWHFDYKDWKSYPVTNLTFEDLLRNR